MSLPTTEDFTEWATTQILNLWMDSADIKEMVNTTALQLVDMLMSYVYDTGGDVIATLLMGIPYIGPVLAAIVKVGFQTLKSVPRLVY